MSEFNQGKGVFSGISFEEEMPENGIVENVSIIPMELTDSDEEQRKYYFTAKIELTTGGNYGYTFRVMPKMKWY